jgi:multidrug efflux pump subunit AcrA (membrane-fusion protein)
MKRISRKRVILTGSVVLLTFILVGIVPFPHTVKGPYRILAHTEWALIQVSPDKLLSKLVRNDINRLEHYTLLQFDRQDFIRFSLDSLSQENRQVSQGEFIAEIQSSENRLLLENLIGLVNKARADVDVVRSGEKLSLREAARQALYLAKTELAAYEPQYERSQALFKQKLVSAEEWEISRSTYELYQKNVKVREAELKVVETGEKIETIRSMEAELSRIQSQLDEMKQKIGLGRLIAPISGLLTYHLEDSVLCRISGMDSVVVQMPVPLHSRRYVRQGQLIKIQNPNTPVNHEIEIRRISKLPVTIQGNPFFLVTGVINNPDHSLLPGMAGLAKIQCEALTLMNRLGNAWQQKKSY